ncbi:hypothetical protein AB5J62_24180 [Amycolatopsis sp. cg5]|uniref:hypothetical protein n=1 Tax=Amycolatopsis sp. cg5 TaxID=3238802 RepID=UPI00352432E2
MNIGGLAYDFAGALRAADLFVDVYATVNDVTVERDRISGVGAADALVMVSELRAGDLELEVLWNRLDKPVALFVRYPGDDQAYRAAVEWAVNATDDRLRTYLSVTGSTTVAANSPWLDVPAFVLGAVAGRGYRAIRKDGVFVTLTPEMLARVLRNEPELRLMLGRGDSLDRSLALIALNGGTEGPVEFSRSLLPGGISRLVHHTSGRVMLSPDGAIGIEGRFGTIAAPLPEPEHVVTYAMTNEVLGTHGQFFPRDEFDAHWMFQTARQDSVLQQQYYYRQLGNGSAVTLHVPVVSPWAGIRRMWGLAGHGNSEGLVFGLKTDHPLHIGDRVVLGSGAARIVAGSDVYRLASPAPDSAVLIGQCSSMVKPDDGTATPAEIFKQEWRQIIGPARVFGSTNLVVIKTQNAVRSVADGRFVEAWPEGGPLPEVELGELAPTVIPWVQVRFVGLSFLAGADAASVRRLAGLLGAAAAWAGRHGAGFPRVTIRGRGRVETSVGRQRAAAVAAVLYEGLVAAAAQLRRLGLSFEPDSIAVGYAGVVAGIAEIEVTLPQQDLGQTTLARAGVDDPSPRVVDQVNAAFAQLAPGSAAIPALPSADGSTAGMTLGEPLGASGDVAGVGPDSRVMVPRETEHVPTAVTAGGVSFDSGATSDGAYWESLHQALTSKTVRSRSFMVYVKGVNGKFLVGGALIDGVTLAGHVRVSAAFQRYAAADVSVPIRLMGADPGSPGAEAREAKAFAEALRGDGPYRTVGAASGPLGLDAAGVAVVAGGGFRTVSVVRADDIVWRPMVDIRGRRFGMGYPSGHAVKSLEGALGRVTDHSLRMVREVYTDAAGNVQRNPRLQAWAAATDGARTRPVALFLSLGASGFFHEMPDGSWAGATVERTAELIAKSSAFQELTAGPVRPPLLIVSSTDPATAARMSDANKKFVAKLRALTGPWQTYDYTGPVSFDEYATVVVPPGSVFVEGARPLLGELAHVVSDGLFAFPVPGEARGLGDVRDFVAAVRREVTRGAGVGWSGMGDPVFVSVDCVDGVFARVATGSGVVLELGGRELGEVLLADPGFRGVLDADPGRPVVLVARRGGARVNFGGWGFDFAGALRAAGYFTDVYAPVGEAIVGRDGVGPADLVPVSDLRAGDLRIESLRNKDGNLVALFVRYPDDTPDYQAAVKWAENATADRLRTYVVISGQSRVDSSSPWPAGMVPAFVFGAVAGPDYRAIRKDGVSTTLTPEALARVLRNESDLWSMLGRGGVVDRPLALVALGGETAGVPEFSQALRVGGLSRLLHHVSGRVTLSRDGAIVTDGGTFDTVTPSLPKSEDVVTYAMANEALGTHGQFFPRDESDAHWMFLGGWQDSFLQQQYYYRQLGNGSPLTRYVPFMSPWAGINRLWSIFGHGNPEGLVFGLKTDQPLRIGDWAIMSSGAARIVAGSDVYRLAAPAPDTAITIGHCSSMVRPAGGAVAPAEIFKQEWWQIVGPARVFGGTRIVSVNSTQTARFLQDAGRFEEASPEGGPLPEVMLGDLAPTVIPSVRVRFAGSSRSVEGRQVDDVRRLAALIGAAAAWAARNGAALPRVTIRGRGRVETPGGRQRAAAVAAVLNEGLVAAAAQLRRLGLRFEPDSIVIGYVGDVEGGAWIEVAVSRQDIGQAALTQLGSYPSSSSTDQVNAAFAQLAPGSAAIPALPSAGGATAGPVFGAQMAMASGDDAAGLDSGVMVPRETEHVPTAVTAGGVSFDSGATSDGVYWESLHQALTSKTVRSRSFMVYVKGVNGKFLVGGALIDGVTLAGHVRVSAAFQRYAAADVSVAVYLVGADPGSPGAEAREAEAFAEALRGEGPYRTVGAASGPLGLDAAGVAVVAGGGFRTVSVVRADDIVWRPMVDFKGRRFGMGYPSGRVVTSLESALLPVTDHSLRMVREIYTDAAGNIQRDPRLQAWAAATDGARTRPVALFLTLAAGGFFHELTDGSWAGVAVERTAELIAKSSAFQELTAGPVRPPLLIVSSTDPATAARMSDANEQFVAKLRALTGPWQTYDYTGPFLFDKLAIAVVPPGSVFVEGARPLLGELAHVVSDGLFAFPVPGEARGLGDVRDFVAAVRREVTRGAGVGWSGMGDPVFVSVDCVDGVFARVATGSGVVVELGGRELGEVLLADPGFRGVLDADPGRPVVLVARRGGARVNFGGWGFDFAGALRAAGYFTDVYAPVGEAIVGRDGVGPADLVPVSDLRA